MRVNIKLNPTGHTLDEIVKSARDTWRNFVNDDSAEIPAGTEVHVDQDGSTFTTTMFVNMKVETDGK